MGRQGSFVQRGLTACLGLLASLRGAVAMPSPSNMIGQPTVITPPTDMFVVDAVGLKGQPPKTRFYDFQISEMVGAPDGVAKPMLVVNGRILQLAESGVANMS